MSEWLKDLFIAIGGGATVLFAFLTVLKTIVVRVTNKAIDTSFEKSTVRLTNRLERKSKAYEILLNKEFEYYSKLDIHIAKLVPLVQDIETSLIKANKEQTEESYNHYLSYVLEYIPIAKKLKNEVIMFQPYIPEQIFLAVTEVVKEVQDSFPECEYNAEVLFGRIEGTIDIERLRIFKDDILEKLAFIEVLIKERLTVLSTDESAKKEK